MGIRQGGHLWRTCARVTSSLAVPHTRAAVKPSPRAANEPAKLRQPHPYLRLSYEFLPDEDVRCGLGVEERPTTTAILDARNENDSDA